MFRNNSNGFWDFYHGTNQCFYLWQFIAIFLGSQNVGYPYKRKKGGFYFFFDTKWTWANGDGSEGILQWFGFTNLNPNLLLLLSIYDDDYH
jgi:hypothetical protein